jgi:membrane-bound lytic murein transglycosylase MltF
VVALTACGREKPAEQKAEPIDEVETPLPPSDLETQLPPSVREAVLKPFTGDLDELVKRRVVRIGVTFNRTFYFVDKGVQRGIAYEYGQLMEDRLNQHFKTPLGNRIHVIFLPLPREMLLSALTHGKVDLVAAQVPVTPELAKYVDFSDPTRMNVNQILVTGPGAPTIGSVEDLAGREVFARKFGGYDQTLIALNERFKAEGKPLVVIRDVPPSLEDDDLLEMVNAGLIPTIVVDDYLALFWSKVFPNLLVHENVPLRTGGRLAIAVRKNNPQLLAALNTFMGKYGLGSAFGNQTERKYLVDATYAKSATSEKGRKTFLTVVDLFRKYSDRYKVDFLLMAAQGYQESGLDQNARSRVGAIGVMQIMPETGKSLKVGDITKLEPNIHAGVKYMRSLRDRNFENEPMDDLNKALFTFAAYNAGPGRVGRLRAEAEKRGLNPNVWFGNVEQIASERIGRETVTYVANIFKYYIAYRLVEEETQRRKAAKGAVKTQ